MCIRDRSTTYSWYTNVVADTLSRMFQLPNTRPGEDKIETTTVNTLITEFPLAFKGIAPVSYTHLDVYKRQELT